MLFTDSEIRATGNLMMSMPNVNNMEQTLLLSSLTTLNIVDLASWGQQKIKCSQPRAGAAPQDIIHLFMKSDTTWVATTIWEQRKLVIPISTTTDGVTPQHL